MTKQLFGLSFAFIVLAPAFWVVEFYWPSIPGQPRLRRGFGIDVPYWFFTPMLTKGLAQLATLAALIPIFLLLGRKLDAATTQRGYGPILALPVWLQAVVIITLGDFIGYWSHRWFHGRVLWKFHAIHHSSRDLDWLSSSRLHPVNDVVTRLCQVIPFGIVGFSPSVVAAYIPFLTIYAIALYANVSWTLGPVRCVIASPHFHRWHHTKEDEGIDKNFSGLLPVWDLMFGTFYLPEDRVPTEFGVHDDSAPEGFLAQLAYPFRSAKVPESQGSTR